MISGGVCGHWKAFGDRAKLDCRGGSGVACKFANGACEGMSKGRKIVVGLNCVLQNLCRKFNTTITGKVSVRMHWGGVKCCMV
jgi:hypothetical protein